MNSFTLEPYVGALPIRFGMTPGEVERLFGPSEEVVERDELGERDERRKYVSVRYSKAELEVTEIAFHSESELWFHNAQLFGLHSLLEYLVGFDSSPFECDGFLIFQELGITLTGFHDEDESQKAITVFRRGRWDEFRNEFRPYSP